MIDVTSDEPKGILLDFDLCMTPEGMEEVDWTNCLMVSSPAPYLFIMLITSSIRAQIRSTPLRLWKTTMTAGCQ